MTFFSNIKNLNIAQFSSGNPICKKILDPAVIRTIAMYRKHPIILAINRKCDSKSRSDFQCIDRKNCFERNQKLVYVESNAGE